MDFETRIHVNLLQWILQAYCASKRGAKLSWTKDHKFYNLATMIWDKYHGFEPTNEAEVKTEIIWQNKRILKGNTALSAGEWGRAGITHISDICQNNSGRFLSHLELSNKFNVTCFFLDILKIRLSIPLHWRRMLTDLPTPLLPRTSDFEVEIHEQDPVDATAMGAKALYSLLIGGNDKVSMAYHRWTETL